MTVFLRVFLKKNKKQCSSKFFIWKWNASRSVVFAEVFITDFHEL